MEFADFFIDIMGVELDENGFVFFDFKEELIKIAASEETTLDLLSLIL